MENSEQLLMTSDSGNRIEIDGPNNNMILYVNDVEYARLDDDSTVETYSGYPNYTTTFGPGYSVGRHVGHEAGFSSMGRMGFYTDKDLVAKGNSILGAVNLGVNGAYSGQIENGKYGFVVMLGNCVLPWLPKDGNMLILKNLMQIQLQIFPNSIPIRMKDNSIVPATSNTPIEAGRSMTLIYSMNQNCWFEISG